MKEKTYYRCSLCNHGIGDGELDYEGVLYPVHKDRQICKDNIMLRLIEVQARLRKSA